MGDGGVACMPLQQQQQQHVMERLQTAAEKPLCGGKGGDGFSSELLNKKKKKKKLKVKKKVAPAGKKGGALKSELASERVSSRGSNDVESGEICGQKEEVEEGELGTLKWPRSEVENGEFVPEKPSRRSEIENGEIVSERWKKAEVEKGEVFFENRRKEDAEKWEIVAEKGRKGEAEKGAHGSWRGGMKDDIEKGEFIPNRWHRGDRGKDDYGYSRISRYQLDKDNGWKGERERTSSFGRYTNDEFFRKKELNRSGSQHAKSAPRWESGQERNTRISSKIVGEEKNEYNGRNHTRDYSSGSRLKRHGNESDCSERKQYGDYAGLKSRRLSDDGSRHVYAEHYSRLSLERSYRNSSSKLSVDKYSSRHHESSLPTRSAYDKHGRSPIHSERSPHDRARHDHKDRTLARRSPYGRDRSPYTREKSPHGRERSPCDRNWDRSRHHDHKLRSPAHVDLSPKDRGRQHDHCDRTPNLVERSPLDQTRQNIHRETSNKTLSSEKHNSQYSFKNHENKNIQKESNLSGMESQGERNVHDGNGSIEKGVCNEPEKEQQSCSPAVSCKDSPCLQLPPEELPSMEEDMDICDTPPHVPVVADSSPGKWFYLDYCGVEHGPSKLSDIKILVDDGVLMSDHFVKHIDSDRWLTVENAASPMAAQSFRSIVSDNITQLVNPPEASGNLLADTGDILQSSPESYQEMPAPLLQQMVCPDDSVTAPELLEDLHIDERVGVLLEGYDVIPGRELEAIKGVFSCQ